MARGWESKSVEAQQADRDQDRPADVPLSPEDVARQARIKGIELARARALADLSAARSPAHRAMLESAIRALDDQLRRA